MSLEGANLFNVGTRYRFHDLVVPPTSVVDFRAELTVRANILSGYGRGLYVLVHADWVEVAGTAERP
jgi:hypothetical protein